MGICLLGEAGRGDAALRSAEIWWDFTGLRTLSTHCMFTLMIAKTWWVSEAGAVCSAIGSNAIRRLFPEEIILLTAPLRMQVTKVLLKNRGYRSFSFQLVKPNFKCNEVMLEIKLQIWKLCIFGMLWSKYPKYNNASGQKAKKKCIYLSGHVDFDTVSRSKL